MVRVATDSGVMGILMQLGEWDVQIIQAGAFRLDGGAVFGTVPKVVWSRVIEADELNRIRMTCNVLLVRGYGRVILVDSGNGDKEGELFKDRMALEGESALFERMDQLGVPCESVTDVVLTHLHFDHAGGCTRRNTEGKIVPSFPNATHWVQHVDLKDARKPSLRARASYLAHNWQPLEKAGLLHTVEGEHELAPGITMKPFPGHNRGNQGVVVEGGGRKLVYPGDLIPSSFHLQPAWAMAFDLDVERCVEERLKLLDEICGTDTLLVFDHDPNTPAGTVSKNDQGKYVLSPVDL